MAGFGKITFIAEHFSNSIVNVFHYRSTEWLPLQGNPFDDVQAILSAVCTKLMDAWLDCHNSDTTLLRAEAVGYDDAYNIVTSSPLVQTINTAGNDAGLPTTGSFISANIGLRCGEQVNINGIGQSKRNRGYLSIGPVSEGLVDSYGHLSGSALNVYNALAQVVDDPIVVVAPAVTLTPIRVHEKWLQVGPLRTLLFRTYSDVRGYTLPRKASVRRSRMGEA